jgi:ATP-dependent DNA helicase RecQ
LHEKDEVGERKRDSIRETLGMFRSGLSVEDIAFARNFVPGTILTHLATAVEEGEEIDLTRFVSVEDRAEIEAAFEELGDRNLTGVRDHLGERFTYDALRICRALRRREGAAVAA